VTRAKTALVALATLAAIVPSGARAEGPIVVCQHVSITGAAPIPHDAARFGQFYFDGVNSRGGIEGRPVEMLTYDDQSYPAGARAALEKCRESNPVLYVGESGRDEVISGAKWAYTHGAPYLHSEAALAETGGCSSCLRDGAPELAVHRCRSRGVQ